MDGGPRHDVVRGQLGHDTCVSSPGGGVDRFVSCEDRTAFDLQIDDALDWGFLEDAAGVQPGAGDDVVTTIRVTARGTGHAGYRRTMVPARELATGTATVLTFDNTDDAPAAVALPFRMPFFGIPYRDVSVSTNGWAGFGTGAWDFLDDLVFYDYRGFNYAVANFYHALMPFWGDLHLANGVSGPGSVSVIPVNAHQVAIQWDAGEYCCGAPPQRKFQAVLFDDGRIRYDYGESTPPDATPNPGFVGLSSGTGARAGLDTVRRSPYTLLTQDVTLPQGTIRVESTRGFKIPGDVLIAYDEFVTCTGKALHRFTGCTGGTGTFSDGSSAHQPIHTPGKSVLYTPYVSPSPRGPAGKVTLTLPAGSSFVDSSVPCTLAQAPTPRKQGLLRCHTPALGQGDRFVARITWTVPPAIGNGQPSPPNVEMKAVYMPSKAPRSVDQEEALFAGLSQDTTMAPTLTYTGPTPAHVADPLTFNASPEPDTGTLAFPAVEIRVPAHMHLNSTGIPHCAASLPGFGGGTVACRLPNGVNDQYSADLTFHANAAGTYRPKVTFFADNAPTAAKRRTLTVSP